VVQKGGPPYHRRRPHPRAQHALGVCYYKGEGLPQDKRKSVELDRLAAAQGHAKAQYSLGACFDNGDGVEQENEFEAARHYALAAAQGFTIAEFTLAQCYEYGSGVEDPELAAGFWERAAAQAALPTLVSRPFGGCFADRAPSAKPPPGLPHGLPSKPPPRPAADSLPAVPGTGGGAGVGGGGERGGGGEGEGGGGPPLGSCVLLLQDALSAAAAAADDTGAESPAAAEPSSAAAEYSLEEFLCFALRRAERALAHAAANTADFDLDDGRPTTAASAGANRDEAAAAAAADLAPPPGPPPPRLPGRKARSVCGGWAWGVEGSPHPGLSELCAAAWKVVWGARVAAEKAAAAEAGSAPPDYADSAAAAGSAPPAAAAGYAGPRIDEAAATLQRLVRGAKDRDSLRRYLPRSRTEGSGWDPYDQRNLGALVSVPVSAPASAPASNLTSTPAGAERGRFFLRSPAVEELKEAGPGGEADQGLWEAASAKAAAPPSKASKAFLQLRRGRSGRHDFFTPLPKSPKRPQGRPQTAGAGNQKSTGCKGSERESAGGGAGYGNGGSGGGSRGRGAGLSRPPPRGSGPRLQLQVNRPAGPDPKGPAGRSSPTSPTDTSATASSPKTSSHTTATATAATGARRGSPPPTPAHRRFA